MSGQFWEGGDSGVSGNCVVLKIQERAAGGEEWDELLKTASAAASSRAEQNRVAFLTVGVWAVVYSDTSTLLGV